MIVETRGNILASAADALVNPINTRGVMGAGLALQVKRAYPSCFAAYKAACARGEVRVGRMWVVPLPPSTSPSSVHSASASTANASSPASSSPSHSSNPTHTRYLVNFPTKGDWRAPSRMAYIDDGLADLARWIAESGVRSIAVPMLGCGKGGLAWGEVRPRIEAALGGLPVRVELYV